MATDYANIKIPREDFLRHSARKRAVGLTRAEYIDHVAPVYTPIEDLLRVVIRDGIREAIDEADVDAEALLTADEPEPEPLDPLAAGTRCLLCEEDIGSNSGTTSHLLTEHSTEVNSFMAELRARQNGNGTVPEPETENGSDPLRVNTDGPVSFGEVPVETPGHAWGNGATPDRECDECGAVLSKAYGRVFADSTGALRCPGCASRSQRYSMDTPTDGDGRTDPSALTGSSNAQYRATGGD